MVRWFIGSVVAVAILSIGMSGAEAAKGKKKSAEKRIRGQIQAVSEDGNLITVGKPHKADGKKGKKKNGDAGGNAKKKGGKNKGPKEIKIDANTVIDYVGIDNQDEKKLLKDYYVLAVMGDDQTAKTLSVSKTPFESPKAKKGKKKAA